MSILSGRIFNKMKRSYFKKKPYKLKRTRLRKKSSRALIIDEIENYLRAKLKKERGSICQICESEKCKPIGLFHILDKGRYPKIRFHEGNLLLAGWLPCHHTWHHNPYKSRDIYKRIQELRGRNNEDDLKIIDKISPKLTISYLQNLLLSYKMESEV